MIELDLAGAVFMLLFCIFLSMYIVELLIRLRCEQALDDIEWLLMKTYCEDLCCKNWQAPCSTGCDVAKILRTIRKARGDE